MVLPMFDKPTRGARIRGGLSGEAGEPAHRRGGPFRSLAAKSGVHQPSLILLASSPTR